MNNSRPNLAPPLAKYRNAASKIVKRALVFLPPSARLAIGFGALVLLTTLLVVNPYTKTPGENYKESDIARQTIVSPADITETDYAETQKWRDAARETVKPIFVFEPNRAAQANSNSLPKFAEINKILQETTNGYIYDEADTEFLGEEITIIDLTKPNQQASLQMPINNMRSVSAARAELSDRILEIKNLATAEKENFAATLVPLIEPNVKFDRARTVHQRELAATSIPTAQVSLKRGQVIAREGDTVTPQMLSQIAAIRAYSQSTRQLNRFLGVLFIVAAFFWIVRKYIQYRTTTIKLNLSPNRIFALVGLSVLLQTAMLNAGFLLANFVATENVRAPLNDASIWAFCIPFASSALLVTMLVDAQIALVTAILTAMITGLIAPRGVEFTIFAAISAATAIYGITRYQNRQSVTFAGLFIGAMNAACGIALIGYMQLPFILNTVLLAIGCGILGGIIAAAVTAVLLPVFETLFGILTDIKLLELSNANLPILGELALRAPGTNQHSHAVGQLTENACRVIGANPLLARIGALYHDIGKLAAPDHFIENQHGTNPHDHLKPIQSARIVVSHVSYGVKLGREIGLPERIVDFIAQHHGTRTLHYFLTKAEAKAACSPDEHGVCRIICENDFRYPGPKPQFKETGVLMIADSCEAAVRTLDHPSPEKIRIIVNKIIDAILADDQLDECDLSLRELTQIRESMIQSLAAIYHPRISYPGFTVPQDARPPSLGNGQIVFEDLPEKEIFINNGGEIQPETVAPRVETIN